MLSTSIFSSNGSIYDQSAVFGTTFQLNQTALGEVGLPALTGSNAWANLTANLSVNNQIICYHSHSYCNFEDRRLDCALYSFLGALCQGVFQTSEDEDTARSSLEGTLGLFLG